MHSIGWLILGVAVASGVGTARADGYGKSWPRSWRQGQQTESFRRIATLPNYLNSARSGDVTVSEIVTSTENGELLVYTDGPLEEIGFVDIFDPSSPSPAGKLPVGGEPTSVAVLGDDLALVAVNTSASLTEPSGKLVVVDLVSFQILVEHPLRGQPDSIAISPDGSYAAIAIENERDEDLVVDGVEGGLPQSPPGSLAIVELDGGSPKDYRIRSVELTGLSSLAPNDPEVEFVDINRRNEAVVTLQENNHVVIVDLRKGTVVGDFSAGTSTLTGVDATEDGVISLSQTLLDVPREPDAVAWIPGKRGDLIATANEGDLFGGSRGFSIFNRSGKLLYDSGSSLEEIAVRFGHYPEARSDAKGSEPEAIESGRFGKKDYLFVGSERGSFVAVYELDRRGQPEFVQLLPAPLGPEGVHAIPSRGLLAVSGEEDDPNFGVRSSVMIYELGPGEPSYPQLVAGDDQEGKPIAWSAMSGMTSVPWNSKELLAVWDSFYSESRIFTIDVSEKPAVITDAITIGGGSGGYDPEGITIAPDGTLWVASEGNAGARSNLLIQTDLEGKVLQEVPLPEKIVACRARSTNRGTLASGFEGVAASGTRRGYRLLVAQQRGWDYTTPECEALDDDPDGTNPSEPRQTRLWIYDPGRGSWSHASYELEPLPANASWVGLSEITAVPGGYLVIERDNRTGDFGKLKTLVRFSDRALEDGRVARHEKQSYDLLPDLLESRGWITDKPEGVAVSRSGQVFLVTDNDGVDDWSGETWFLRLGRLHRLFR